MKIEFSKTYLKVFREPGDKKYYDSKDAYGTAESGLLYAVKKALIAMGFDVIKLRMQFDKQHCHMMGDSQTQYIRSRKLGPGSIMIYDPNYAIRNLAKEWNKEGKITLCVSPRMEESQTKYPPVTMGTIFLDDNHVVFRVCSEDQKGIWYVSKNETFPFPLFTKFTSEYILSRKIA